MGKAVADDRRADWSQVQRASGASSQSKRTVRLRQLTERWQTERRVVENRRESELEE